MLGDGRGSSVPRRRLAGGFSLRAAGAGAQVVHGWGGVPFGTAVSPPPPKHMQHTPRQMNRADRIPQFP